MNKTVLLNRKLVNKVKAGILLNEAKMLTLVEEEIKQLIPLLEKKLNKLVYSNTKRQENFARNYRIYLNSKRWKELRQEILKRDEYKCLICGNQAEAIHHISYAGYIHNKHSERIECGSVCNKCHEEIHYLNK